MIWTIAKGVFSWLVTALFGPKQTDVAKSERDAGEALGRSEQKSETDEKVLQNVAKAQAAARAVDNQPSDSVSVHASDGFRRD